MAKILVLGGAGYVGSALVPKLIEAGHSVRVFDARNDLEEPATSSPSLRMIQGDLRDEEAFKAAVRGCGAVIDLASGPGSTARVETTGSFDRLNPSEFAALVASSQESGVRRFIALTMVSETPTDEASDLGSVPSIASNGEAGGVLQSILRERESEDFTPVVIRSGTICGYSPRMQFDLGVNRLIKQVINQACETETQAIYRSISIADVTDLYVLLLNSSSKLISGRTIDAVQQTSGAGELIRLVERVVRAEFPGLLKNDDLEREVQVAEVAPTRTDHEEDWHDWSPRRSIESAIVEVCAAIKDGLIPEGLVRQHLESNVPLKRTELVQSL